MKTFGIVSYNKYANFTNYGSALQSWALNTVINKVGESMGWRAMFVDYCPDILAKLDPLNPFKNMWDRSYGRRKYGIGYQQTTAIIPERYHHGI